MFSLILTLTALGNLFNLFLVGILFTVSVARHHHISLIVGLLPAACHPRPSSGTPRRSQAPPAVLRHPRPSSSIPGRHLWPPTLFILMCPAVIPNTCRLYPPPAVLAHTLRSFDTPYSPPQNPGRPSISPSVPLSNRYHVCPTTPRKA